jgi:hypothetical protein
MVVVKEPGETKTKKHRNPEVEGEEGRADDHKEENLHQSIP